MGGASVSGKRFPEEIADCVDSDENCKVAWDGMTEGLVKGAASMMVSVPEAKEILLSGRLTRIRKIGKELAERLSEFAPTRQIGWLPSAGRVKEAAQGYAMVADGLMGGKFSELVDWMEIKKAKGTALDYIHHPKGVEIAADLRSGFFK